MSRSIVCIEHGKIKPTHHEDAARGLFVRYRSGKTKQSLECDVCGLDLPIGTPAVAISQPSTMGMWEIEYLDGVIEVENEQA